MPRLRWIATLTAVAAIACAGVASASVTRVTAGTSQLTLATGANTALTASHLTVTPGAPATQSGSTFTFPVMFGRLNLSTMSGHVAHWGKLIFSNGTTTFRLRRPSIYSNGTTAAVWGQFADGANRTCTAIPGKQHAQTCSTTYTWSKARVGTLTGITHSGNTASATLYPSPALAAHLNNLAGSSTAFSPSTALGTVSTTLS